MRALGKRKWRHIEGTDMYLGKQTDVPIGLTPNEIRDLLCESLKNRQLRKVLLIPPDYTRYHSNAGFITCEYWKMLTAAGCQVDVMPALGSHEKVSRMQWEDMYPDIPYAKMIVHNWRTDVVKIGEVPGDFLSEITDGFWREPISCEVNRRIMDPEYDLILSIGQVVPHEVVGMSNESKNIFVGTGGKEMINKSHMICSVCGIENAMGLDHTPVRKIFDYCKERYLADRPILYVLTVTTAKEDCIVTHGVFIGNDREPLERAIALSQKWNITCVDRPIKKCVVYLTDTEFKSFWVGSKAIYRTRMALDNGGELLVLAPGLKAYGEDKTIDNIIKKYGYCGRDSILEAIKTDEDLKNNLGAAAQIIMASPEGRFSVTFAVRDMPTACVEAVGFRGVTYDEAINRYDPQKLLPGWNCMDDGEEIFFIQNPALGLWKKRSM